MNSSLTFLLLPLLALAAPRADARLNVVATTPDFGAIARDIGGDRIDLTVCWPSPPKIPISSTPSQVSS